MSYTHVKVMYTTDLNLKFTVSSSVLGNNY